MTLKYIYINVHSHLSKHFDGIQTQRALSWNDFWFHTQLWARPQLWTSLISKTALQQIPRMVAHHLFYDRRKHEWIGNSKAMSVSAMTTFYYRSLNKTSSWVNLWCLQNKAKIRALCRISNVQSFITLLPNMNYMVSNRWSLCGRKTTKLQNRDRRTTWSEYKTCLFSLCTFS